MASRPKSTHQSIPLSTKVEIIKAVDSKQKSKTSIAKDFNVARSTISSIIKNKEKTLDAFESSSFLPDRKRLRTTTYTDIEDALLLWFKQARSLNVSISGPILQTKARELATLLGHPQFVCSSGWLERFKIRHGIAFRQMSSEAASVTEDTWLGTKLPALLSEFQPDDIFNANETGLFWKCLPDKTLHLKGEACSGGEKSTDRITVLVCSNMTGTAKLPLLVVGRFAKPRCFGNVQTLPVQYEANHKAWMVSDLFTKWLTKLDKQYQRAGRKVAMVIDNCPAHPNVQTSLEAMKLIFLPHNTTSKLQPCDEGIIQNLKMQYRKYLLIKLIAAIEAKEEFSPNLLDALYLLRLSWDNVAQQTIANCFRRCGFAIPEGSSSTAPSHTDDPESADRDSILARLGSSGFELPEGVTFDDFAEVDNKLITTEKLSDEDIVSIVQQGDMDTDSNDEVDDSEIPLPPPSAKEADKSLDVLKRYLESRDPQTIADLEQYLPLVSTLERAIANDIITHPYRPN